MRYSPRHAIARAVRSLSPKARAAVVAGAVLAAGGGLALASVPSGAATGGPFYSTASAGYKATGGQFRFISTTTYLRSPAQYSTTYQPWAELDNAAGNGPEVELIPSGTPSTAVWHPNADLGGLSEAAVHYTWTQNTAYVPGSPCWGDTDSRGCFDAGQTVTQTVYYDQYSHQVRFTALDKATGNEYTAYSDLGAKQSFTVAGTGTLLESAYSGTYAAPASAQKLSAFSSVSLTSYSGRNATLGGSWWAAHPYVMVGSESTDSPVEASPSALSASGAGFSVTLQP